MSEARVVHEWKAGRFCYRAITGKAPGVERGGGGGTLLKSWAGVYVCTDSATVNELARLAAENKRLRDWVSDLQAGMYINCVYCGHRYGPDSEVPAAMADVLKEHISICPDHPMSRLAARCERLEGALGEIKDLSRRRFPDKARKYRAAVHLLLVIEAKTLAALEDQ